MDKTDYNLELDLRDLRFEVCLSKVERFEEN